MLVERGGHKYSTTLVGGIRRRRHLKDYIDQRRRLRDLPMYARPCRAAGRDSGRY